METRKIARVVAAEAAYRARRKNVRIGFTPARSVSAAKSNVLLGLFYSFLSATYGIVAAAAPDAVAAAVLMSTVAITAFFNLMMMLSFTAVFFSEQLFIPLQLLPIEPRRIRDVLTQAYLLYWGGLSVTMLAVPATIIVLAANPSRAAYAALALIAAAAAYISTVDAGLILGSYSRLAKSSTVASIASATAWMALMLAFAAAPQVPILLTDMGSSLPLLAALIPYAGIVAAPLYPLPAAASAAATLLAVTVLHRRAARMPIGGAPISVRVAEGFRRLRGLGKITGYVRKDYLLLLREPRRLAGIAYLFIFPFLFIFSRDILLALIAGAAAGVSSPLWLYLEGEAARHLYETPLTFLDVYLAKLLDAAVPLALAAVLLLAGGFIVGASPTLSLLFVLGYLMEASTMLLFALAELPREPSAWNEAALSRGLYIVTMIISISLFTGVPFYLYTFYSPLYAVLFAAITAAAATVFGAWYAYRRGPL